jgi:uncharacterized protein
MERRVSAVTSWVKLHPLPSFFVIAYAASYLGGVLDAAYPSDFWALLVYGPFVGALVVTAITQGRVGVRAWLGRIVRWRVGLRWYAVALLLPVGLRLAAMLLNVLLGAPMPTADQLAAWPSVFPEFVFVLLLVALAEEPGFRGFALPALLVGRSALAASLILGVLHVGWHVPLFVANPDNLLLIPIIMSGAIFFTWLYNNTNGSVLIAMLLHASVGAIVGYFSSMFSGADLMRHNVLLCVVYVVAATGVVVLARSFRSAREGSPATRRLAESA